MFNIGKRGLASIPGILRATKILPRLAPQAPSTFNLVRSLNYFKSLNQSQCFHSSLNFKDGAAASANQKELPKHHNVTKFQELEDLKMVHPNIIGTITKNMGHHTLTDVQVATINEGLQGVDIIAQARTGTGKTLGFLIPTIQNILRCSPELANRQRYTRARPSDIRAIIISPTRELAEQIAVEAEKLCYHTDVVVQVAVGGNSKRQMLLKTQRQGCHLLVATPGRLQDLLSDPYSGVKAPKLTTFVLDEADRLLDDGFSKDIEEIAKLLPDRAIVDRQTLLFSATVPNEVMHLVRRTLKPNFHFVQTVKEGELATHQKVPQNVILTVGLENWIPCLLEIAKKPFAAENNSSDVPEENMPRPFKAIVYYSSTAQVELAYGIVRNLKSEKSGSNPLKPAQLYIIHGSMSQEGRTRAATKFRECRTGILFSTDVTARGMDFPGVTHVFQMGLPPNKEQYIHRVGRTGRGDKTGDGYLIIDKSSIAEAKRMLRGLPIFENKDVSAAKVDLESDNELPDDVSENFSMVKAASKLCSLRSKEAAYKSALNTVKSAEQTESLARWTKLGLGLERPPPIASILAAKLGISRLPGINIGPPTIYDDEPVQSPFSRGGGSGGYGDRSRGGYGNRSSSGFGDREGRGGFGNREGRGGFGYSEGRGGFGNREGRGGFGNSEGRGGFGNREGRGGFGNGEGRGGFGNREGRGFGNSEGRGGFGNREGRGSFGNREGRGSFGNREGRGSFGNREGRGGFGNGEGRGGFGNREGRGGFGSSEGRGGFGSREGRGSFGNRESRGSFGNRGRGGFGSRGDRGNFTSREDRGSFGNQ